MTSESRAGRAGVAWSVQAQASSPCSLSAGGGEPGCGGRRRGAGAHEAPLAGILTDFPRHGPAHAARFASSARSGTRSSPSVSEPRDRRPAHAQATRPPRSLERASARPSSGGSRAGERSAAGFLCSHAVPGPHRRCSCRAVGRYCACPCSRVAGCRRASATQPCGGGGLGGCARRCPRSLCLRIPHGLLPGRRAGFDGRCAHGGCRWRHPGAARR